MLKMLKFFHFWKLELTKMTFRHLQEALINRILVEPLKVGKFETFDLLTY